jgi:hypothetical protein
VDRFSQSGQHETVNSWVEKGPNQPVTPSQLEQALGPDVLDKLSAQIGVPREELLARLTRELPNAVDKYTPEGRLPTEEHVPQRTAFANAHSLPRCDASTMSARGHSRRFGRIANTAASAQKAEFARLVS